MTESSDFSSLHGRMLYAGILLALLIVLRYVHFNVSGLLCLAVVASVTAACSMVQTGSVKNIAKQHSA